MFYRKKLGQRFILPVIIVFFLSLFILFLWMEYKHEKLILEELENQKKVIFVQVVYSPEGREQIQKIQYQKSREIAYHFEETPFRVVRSISRGLMLTLFFALGMGFIFHFWLRSWLFEPLQKITRGIKTLNKGNTSFRLNLKSAYEIEELSQEFNQMAERLEKSFVEVQRKAEELKRTQEQLTHSEKLSTIGRMSAALAHELNNPLTAVLNYTELLLSETKKDDLHYDDLKKIEQETRRILKIIRNLLTYSRPRELNFAPVEISKVIDHALELIHHETKYKNLEIVKNYNNDLPLKGDEDELTQVFVNLFTNALHAFKEKDKLYKIIIGMKYNQMVKTVEIEVSDTGEGIPSENLQHIFEPFFTTKGRDKGAGLGLFVVHGIISRHQGKIEVKSEVGKGTTFLITLPVGFEKEIQ